MKKTALSLIICGVCACVLGAAETPNKYDSVSFNQLLGQLMTDTLKDFVLTEPSAAKDESGALAADERFWVTVSASGRSERTKLLAAGMDIVEVQQGSVSGFVHVKTLAILSEKGYVVLDKMTMAQYIKKYNKDFPSGDAAFHNYAETTGVLQTLAANNSDIASLFSIGRSIEGRDIWCLRINSSAKDAQPSAKPGAVFVGTHHAREHLATEVPLLFAAWLFDHKGDADVKKYIEGLDIYIVPMLNPDGVEYDIATGKYKWQRKNMRVNSDKSIGVDLNRNYDSWFGGEGSSHYTYSETYCGTAPFSEPETQAVRNLVEARKNLKTFMSYHSYGSTVIYPWGGKDAPVENERDRNVFIKMAGKMASATGYRPEQANVMYVATGDTCDWAYEKAKVFSFTTELEGGSFYPSASIIGKAVAGNVKAAVYMLSVTEDPYKAVN